jgi:hypothetical protein
MSFGNSPQDLLTSEDGGVMMTMKMLREVAMMTERKLQTKFAGICWECGEHIPAGAWVMWHPEQKWIRHESCEPPATRLPEERAKISWGREDDVCWVCRQPIAKGDAMWYNDRLWNVRHMTCLPPEKRELHHYERVERADANYVCGTCGGTIQRREWMWRNLIHYSACHHLTCDPVPAEAVAAR